MRNSMWSVSAAGYAVLAVLVPSLGQAQSILSLLPTDGRVLSMDSESTGALSSDDVRGADGAPLEAWAFDGTPGSRVIIDLRSDDFDAYLHLVGPGFPDALSDDDGGGGCDARLDVTLLESGVFTIVATSLSGGTGTYTVSVSDVPGPTRGFACGDVDPLSILDLPTADRVLEFGSGVRDFLDPGAPLVHSDRPAEAWAYEATAGERVTFRLISDEFDAYLYLYGPGLSEVLSDDDSAGGLDAELTVTFPESGSYRVVASALGTGSTGSYVIEVVAPLDLTALPTDGRTVVIGSTASGILPEAAPVVLEGRPGHAWALEVEVGQRLTVDVVSEVFDTYVYVVGPGIDEPLSNDDGGDGTNARLAFDAVMAGRYLVIVSAYSSGASGPYELTVTAN